MDLSSKNTYIFDMDGTLVNLEALNSNAYSATINHFYGHNISSDDYQKYFSGTKTAKAFQGYLDSQDVIDGDVDVLIEYFRKIKRDQLRNNTGSVCTMIPFAKEFLIDLKEKQKTIILATSTVTEFVDIILDYFEIATLFDYVLTGDDVSASKPNPEIYNRSLKISNSKRDESVVFEDSKNGIQSAKNAKILCIGIHTEGLNDNYVNKADYVIEDYEELIIN